MEIRILQPEEYQEGVLVAHGVFDYCLKQRIADRQLIDGFYAYADETAIRQLAQEKRITLWGVFEENRMVGVSAMQSEGHITMIYVYSAFQRRGYGSRLLVEMRRYAGAKYGLREVTLNALPAWTAEFFEKRGFHPVKLAPGTQLPFVPLEAKAIDSYRTYEKKPIPGGVIVGVSISGLILCFLIAIVFMVFYLL
jgi:ribosomal protein S18 acetylase RimI-like enzyme